MTIASEVQRIKTNIASAYTALGEKGATIPEVKNSENLSDAIGSIATGGGSVEGNTMRGGWTVPNICLELDNAIENIEQSEVYQNAKRATALKYNTTVGVLGVVLRPGYHELKFSASNSIMAVEISDGRSFYSYAFDSSNPQTLSFTLNTVDEEKYMIIYWCNDTTDEKAFGYEGDYTLKQIARYYALKDRIPSVLVPASNVESFNIIGTIEEKFKRDEPKAVFGYNDSMSSCCGMYYPKMSFWCKTNTVTGLTYRSFLVGSNGLLFSALPDDLDLSNYTDSDTFVIGSNDTYMSSGATTTLKNWRLYVKLPATNVEIRKICLSKDNWTYIAEHAPAVDSKTLTMGTANIAICGGEASEIITTLKSKGWTIA